MADTGAPWNIPYVESTDLVRDYPTDSLALADAIADGLDAAGGLVAVKTVVKTDTQSSSIAAGGHVAISGLTISHAVADASNKVLLTAQVNGGRGVANVLCACLTAGGVQLNLGDSAGSRRRVAAVNMGDSADDSKMSSVFLQALHTPGSTSSVTYGADIMSDSTATQTYLINRATDDADTGDRARTSSVLTLLEVKV